MVVPAVKPNIDPELDPITATPGTLELHVPPGTASATAIVSPEHTIAGVPVIGASGFTVTFFTW